MSAPHRRCRWRRQRLLSSVYHNTPLVRRFIAALDDGLHRHSPCCCRSCRSHKRSSAAALPPPKRMRSPSSSSTSSTVYYCHWCSFPHHSPRLSCRHCARRTAPPAMVQHFRPTATAKRSAQHYRPSDRRAAPIVGLEHPQTPLPEERPYPSSQFSYSPHYPAPPLPGIQVSVPEHPYVPPAQAAHLPYHSPQSTILDPAELTDYESISTPESPSMASKSITRVDKHPYTVDHSLSTHENDHVINVASLMEDVSKEVVDDDRLPVDSARFSLESEISNVTTKSVVELGGVENDHSKDLHHKHSPDHHEQDADIFLSEIIMSEEEKDTAHCNEISDLPLTFLEEV